MKIEDRLANYMSLLNTEPLKSAARPVENSGQVAANESDAVSVEISAAASEMAEDRARLDKVNAIRQQLAEGSYNISGKDVADKILKIIQN